MDNREYEKVMKKIENSVFRYYNNNPHHKQTEDCVIRAIAAGTGDSWEETARKLTEYMIKTGEMHLNRLGKKLDGTMVWIWHTMGL